jgi:hypothetical protein
MFRKLACIVAICAVLPLGGASASGPLYSEHHASEPAISAGSGRIYLYRPSAFWGAPSRPAIAIDGVKIGRSEEGTYFYVDRAPGAYTVSTVGRKEEPVSVHLDAGQTIYVRFRASPAVFGWHIIPAVVDDTRGVHELNDCHFVGGDAPPAPATETPAQMPPKN